MNSTALFLFVFMGVVAVKSAPQCVQCNTDETAKSAPESIQCFQCNTDETADCADPFVATKQDRWREGCRAGSTTCLKKVTGSKIVRSCNDPATANCSQAIVDNPPTTTYCCAGNACNTASINGANILITGVTLLARWMF